MFEKPCGIVIGVRELFNSESKSQVYGHLHTLFYNGKLGDVGKFKSFAHVTVCVCVTLLGSIRFAAKFNYFGFGV